MTDQRLRDGGMWFSDEPLVTADGYLEDWGHQDATAAFGPTCDGVSRGSYNPRPPGPRGDGIANPRLNHRGNVMPRSGGLVQGSD